MSKLSKLIGININLTALFHRLDPKGLAQHVLDNLKPALIQTVNRDIAKVPDNISIDVAKDQIVGNISGSLYGALGHNPLLLAAGKLLIADLAAHMGSIRAIDARSTKAQAMDWIDARIQGARL